MFILPPNFFYLLTTIITIMEKLRNVDVYYCKLVGSCEQLFMLHAIIKKSYHQLIRQYVDNNTFPSHHCLSEDDKNWWMRFIDWDDDGESVTFVEFLRLIKKHNFWLVGDSMYLKSLIDRIDSLVDWCYDYYQESEDLPF